MVEAISRQADFVNLYQIDSPGRTESIVLLSFSTRSSFLTPQGYIKQQEGTKI